MTSGTVRDALYAQLRDVLMGENEARTMMQLLPPGEVGELATKSDMDRFERSLEKFDDRLHDFHAARREQTRS